MTRVFVRDNDLHQINSGYSWGFLTSLGMTGAVVGRQGEAAMRKNTLFLSEGLVCASPLLPVFTSRAYIPASIWETTRKHIVRMISDIRTGDVSDLKNFMNAVIDEPSFDRIISYINKAKSSPEARIIAGGKGDKSKGYFIEPTIILTENPRFITMEEEIFGPVMTIFVYDDAKFEETLKLCDETSPYGLTGSIFSNDKYAMIKACRALRYSSGNFYINDKPTGAMVGQQPFGGARASGTNDKAGSYLNLLRWVSPRTIKETLMPATDFKYPFME